MPCFFHCYWPPLRKSFLRISESFIWSTARWKNVHSLLLTRRSGRLPYFTSVFSLPGPTVMGIRIFLLSVAFIF